MSQVHIVAIFYPLPETVARVKELLVAQCSAVYQTEDYALRFILTEKISENEVPEFCLFETYESEKAIERHLSEPHFGDMMKKMREENLLRTGPYVARTTSVAGFDLDRNFVSAGGQGGVSVGA